MELLGTSFWASDLTPLWKDVDVSAMGHVPCSDARMRLFGTSAGPVTIAEDAHDFDAKNLRVRCPRRKSPTAAALVGPFRVAAGALDKLRAQLVAE